MHNKHFEFTPSNFLRNWVIGTHLFAGLILFIMPIAFIIKCILLVLIILCYFYSQTTSEIYSFGHHQNQDWFLYNDQGEKQLATLSSNNFISNFLLILFFNNKQHLILFRHQLTDANWRYLQQLLRR